MRPLGEFSHYFNLVQGYNKELRQGRTRLGAGDAPNTSAAVLIAVSRTWVHAGTIQGQVVAIVEIVRSRRPIEAVATPIVRGRRSEVAGVEEVIRISS